MAEVKATRRRCRICRPCSGVPCFTVSLRLVQQVFGRISGVEFIPLQSNLSCAFPLDNNHLQEIGRRIPQGSNFLFVRIVVRVGGAVGSSFGFVAWARQTRKKKGWIWVLLPRAGKQNNRNDVRVANGSACPGLLSCRPSGTSVSVTASCIREGNRDRV
jgi:hypothetical protein